MKLTRQCGLECLFSTVSVKTLPKILKREIAPFNNIFRWVLTSIVVGVGNHLISVPENLEQPSPPQK